MSLPGSPSRRIKGRTSIFIKIFSLRYSFGQIASIIKGNILNLPGDREIRDLALDSRKIVFPETALFFALRGPRRDGQAFVRDAYEKGVRNFVIADPAAQDIPDAKGGAKANADDLENDNVAMAGDSRHGLQAIVEDLENANIVAVNDPLAALQQLAAFHRNRFSIPVIGITGSNGKTIVKEWLNQALGDRFAIVRSPKSYNSQIGVPLSVWQLNPSFTLGIFEAGISRPGEMDRLQPIIRPTIGVFTNIGEAHAEGFAGLREKIREKLELFKETKTLVYCKDSLPLHEEIILFRERLSARGLRPFETIAWSRSAGDALLQSLQIEKGNDRTVITAVQGSTPGRIVIPFTDDASIENAIHCWCVLLHLGEPEASIRQKMAALQPVAMRLELKDGINDCSVINDSYSADLSSLAIALDFLGQQTQHDKHTVILTDFLESGRNEEALYGAIADALDQRRISRFIGIGAGMTAHKRAFEKNRNRENLFFDSIHAFKEQFHRLHFAHETILLKGARVFGLEEANELLERQTHQTALEIDLGALLHNLRAHQRLLHPSTKLMAMVKAFSYGSGSYEIAAALQFNKVDYLAVAYADEGVDLRKGGISLPIMVMNPDIHAFSTLAQYHLEPAVYSPRVLRALEDFLDKEGLNRFPAHLELETGMNRLGFTQEDIPFLLEAARSDRFRIQSIFSHLAASEDPAMDDFTNRQASLFRELSDQLKKALDYPVLRHLLNTSGILRHSHLQFDMARIGIGLYGIRSGNELDLQQVSTLKTAIAQVKSLKAGESVGYGRAGVVSRPSRIATVRIGYADGYPRRLGNGRGKMLVKGALAPTIGNICMDMTMIDITDIPEAGEGDEATIFGKSLPVEQVAAWADAIPYEILTGVSQRVKRVYFQD